MKKFKLRKTDLHKSLPNLNLDAIDFEENAFPSNGSCTNLNGHTEMTKRNGHSQLNGRIPLKVILPNRTATIMNVDANTPMMDVLVDVTTANGINPGGMYLKLPIERPPGYLNYKPSTPVGSLNCNVVEIIPKFDLFEKARKHASKKNLPYEVVKNMKKCMKDHGDPSWEFKENPTTQIQVDLPKNQKRVFRVQSRLSLFDLYRRVCEETKYEANLYELRTYACPTIPLDLRSTVADCETAHFLLIPAKANLSKSTGDIFGLFVKMPVEGKEKQSKSRGGLFRFFRRKRRKNEDDQLSSGASTLDYKRRQNDKTMRDKLSTNHQQNRPLSLQFDVSGLVDDSDDAHFYGNNSSTYAAPGQTYQQHRNVKKRPAPKPPSLLETDQTMVNSENRQQSISTLDSDDADSPYAEHRHSVVVVVDSDATKNNQSHLVNRNYENFDENSDISRPYSEPTTLTHTLRRLPSDNLLPVEQSHGESEYIYGYESDKQSPTRVEKSKAPLPPQTYDYKLEQAVASNHSVDRTLVKCKDGLEELQQDSMTEPADLIISSSSRRTSRSSSPATAEEVHQNFKDVIEQMEAEISASDKAKDVSVNNYEWPEKIFVLHYDEIDNDLIDSDSANYHGDSEYAHFMTDIRPSPVYAESDDAKSPALGSLENSLNADSSVLENLESTRLGNESSVAYRQSSDVEARIDRLIFDKSASVNNSKTHSSTIDSLLSTTDLGLSDEWEPVNGSLSSDFQEQPRYNVNDVDSIDVRLLKPVISGLDNWETVPDSSCETVELIDLANESNQTLPQTITTIAEPITVRLSQPVYSGLHDDWEPIVERPRAFDRKQQPALPESPPPDEDETSTFVDASLRSSSTKSPSSHSRERHSFKNLPPTPTSLTSIESPLKLSIVDLADQSSSTVSSPGYRRDRDSGSNNNSAAMSPLPCQPLSPQSKIAVKDSKRTYPTMTVKNFEEEYYAKQMKDEYLHEIKYGYVDPEERPPSKRSATPPVRTPPKPSPVAAATGTWSPSSHPQQRSVRSSRAEINVTVGGDSQPIIKKSPFLQQQQQWKKPTTPLSPAEQTFVATPVRAVGGDERDELLYKEYEKLQTMFSLWQERLKSNEAVVKRGGKLSALDILEFQRVQTALMEQHQLVQKLCPVDDGLQDLKNMSDKSQHFQSVDRHVQSNVSTDIGEKRNISVASVPANGDKETTPFRHQRTVDVIKSSRTPGGGEDSEYEYQQQQRNNELRYTNGQLIDYEQNENRSIDTSSVIKPSQLSNAKKFVAENSALVEPVVVRNGSKDNNNDYRSSVAKAVVNNGNDEEYGTIRMSATEVKTNGKEDDHRYQQPYLLTSNGNVFDNNNPNNTVMKTIFIASTASTLNSSSGFNSKRYVETPSGGSFVTEISFSPQYELIENRTTTRQSDVRINSDAGDRPTDVVKRARENFCRSSQQYVIPPPPPAPVFANPNLNKSSISVDGNAFVVNGEESREDLLRSIRDFGSNGHLKRAI